MELYFSAVLDRKASRVHTYVLLRPVTLYRWVHSNVVAIVTDMGTERKLRILRGPRVAGFRALRLSPRLVLLACPRTEVIAPASSSCHVHGPGSGCDRARPQ